MILVISDFLFRSVSFYVSDISIFWQLNLFDESNIIVRIYSGSVVKITLGIDCNLVVIAVKGPRQNIPLNAEPLPVA